MTGHEAKVGKIARKLWKNAGRPEGRDLEFWCMAERWVIQESACLEKLAQRIITFPSVSASANGSAIEL